MILVGIFTYVVYIMGMNMSRVRIDERHTLHINPFFFSCVLKWRKKVTDIVLKDSNPGSQRIENSTLIRNRTDRVLYFGIILCFLY